jgi:hypothetical protein
MRYFAPPDRRVRTAIFVLFGRRAYDAFAAALKELAPGRV